MSPVHAGCPGHRVIAQLDLVGGDPVPTSRKTNRAEQSHFCSLCWREKDSSHPQTAGCSVATSKPPDGVPALQDDSGEPGEVDGVHLQPLVPVPIHGAPGPVVNVPVLNARLKRHVAEKVWWSVTCTEPRRVLLLVLMDGGGSSPTVSPELRLVGPLHAAPSSCWSPLTWMFSRPRCGPKPVRWKEEA